MHHIVALALTAVMFLLPLNAHAQDDAAPRPTLDQVLDAYPDAVADPELAAALIEIDRQQHPPAPASPAPTGGRPTIPGGPPPLLLNSLGPYNLYLGQRPAGCDRKFACYLIMHNKCSYVQVRVDDHPVVVYRPAHPRGWGEQGEGWARSVIGPTGDITVMPPAPGCEIKNEYGRHVNVQWQKGWLALPPGSGGSLNYEISGRAYKGDTLDPFDTVLPVRGWGMQPAWQYGGTFVSAGVCPTQSKNLAGRVQHIEMSSCPG